MWRTNFWTGAVAMVMLATFTASLVTISAWFVGVFVFMAYPMLATALYLLPPQRSEGRAGPITGGE